MPLRPDRCSLSKRLSDGRKPLGEGWGFRPTLLCQEEKVHMKTQMMHLAFVMIWDHQSQLSTPFLKVWSWLVVASAIAANAQCDVGTSANRVTVR